MWIMGVSMALSFVSILKNQPREPSTHQGIASATLARIKGFGPGSSFAASRSPDASVSNPVGASVNTGVSTSINSGHDAAAAMNPRGRSSTGLASNHSAGTGYDSRSIRNSTSTLGTLGEGPLGSGNSVRSLSNVSNCSATGMHTAGSINSNTTNPLPDYIPASGQSQNNASIGTGDLRSDTIENTLLNAASDAPKLPLTLCGVDIVIWWRVLRRSAILFLIGMFLANGWEYTTWRIPGVLQYFGVSYLVTGFTILSVHSLTKKRLAMLEREYGFIRHSQSPQDEQSVWVKWESLFGRRVVRAFTLTAQAKILTAYYYEWIIQGAILLIYLSVVFGGHVAGCPRGYNGPGGISEHSEYYFCTGGIHRYIDMKVFSWQLIYHHPTCLDMYQCRVYDPEGLLGSLMACTLTYLGLMAGRVVLHFPEHNKRMAAWCTAGFILMFIAGCLCGFSREGGVIPINKNLWSTSFVAITAGGGMVVLSFCYLVVDKWKQWTGFPFRQLGMNSILIYCGHDLLANYMPFSYKIYHVNHGTLLQCNVLGTVAWLIIAVYLYKIKFFVKI